MFTVCHIHDLPKPGREQLDACVLDFINCWHAPGDKSRRSPEGKTFMRLFLGGCELIPVMDWFLSAEDRKKLLEDCAAIIVVNDNVLCYEDADVADEAWEELKGMC